MSSPVRTRSETNRKLRPALLALLTSLIVAPSHAQPTDQHRDWLRAVMLRLASARRFPPEALGQMGTAKVVFRIDHSGKLISAALLENTGIPAFDREALAMVERAQPFPSPPSDVPDDRLQFVVPLAFNGSTASPLFAPSAPSVMSGAPAQTSFDELMKASGFTTHDRVVTPKIDGICRGC